MEQKTIEIGNIDKVNPRRKYVRRTTSEERRRLYFEQLEKGKFTDDGYYEYHSKSHDYEDADCFCE